MIRKIHRLLTLLLPGLIAAGPASMPVTRPTTRNVVKPIGLPFTIGLRFLMFCVTHDRPLPKNLSPVPS